MSHDDLDHIPSIVPSRDEPPAGSAPMRAERGPERRKSATPASKSGGAGWLARLFIFFALVAAAIACAWAWQLQGQLQQADVQLQDYAQRITELEDRLSDTDEGMNQNAAVQAVKVAELESEVRKLWDNVWKKSKERFGKLEAASASQGKSVTSMESALAEVETQLENASGDITKLKSVAGDLSRLMASAKTNQAEVERVADTLNRIDLDLSKLDKRVHGNEEWVGSINAFRGQVNASLTELQATVRAMQATPGAASQP